MREVSWPLPLAPEPDQRRRRQQWARERWSPEESSPGCLKEGAGRKHFGAFSYARVTPGRPLPTPITGGS